MDDYIWNGWNELAPLIKRTYRHRLDNDIRAYYIVMTVANNMHIAYAYISYLINLAKYAQPL